MISSELPNRTPAVSSGHPIKPAIPARDVSASPRASNKLRTTISLLRKILLSWKQILGLLASPNTLQRSEIYIEQILAALLYDAYHFLLYGGLYGSRRMDGWID